MMRTVERMLLRTGAFKRWIGDERGVSAVEFALLLPLLLILYFGSVDLSQGITADRKVTVTARTIADLVSRTPSLTVTDMDDVLDAASSVMAPFPVGNLKLTVSSVKIDGDGNATVDWSRSLNGTAHSHGDPVTLPSALVIKNSSLIWSEAEYLYQPVVGYVITGNLTLTDQLYMSPRKSESVIYPAS
jgi:Flp pilus assembly protein TadG